MNIALPGGVEVQRQPSCSRPSPNGPDDACPTRTSNAQAAAARLRDELRGIYADLAAAADAVDDTAARLDDYAEDGTGDERRCPDLDGLDALLDPLRAQAKAVRKVAVEAREDAR